MAKFSASITNHLPDMALSEGRTGPQSMVRKVIFQDASLVYFLSGKSNLGHHVGKVFFQDFFIIKIPEQDPQGTKSTVICWTFPGSITTPCLMLQSSLPMR
ncbi:hypothetical protein PTH_2325 [Pelotomaculum thermopropionicum SI]|uniref:Uncharacterized protein n=1 Tax=Pelotomaculum thermopropionicum (strain DSM 13744 / JCM 10971 / SI) TaxID=370438 RepID=A5CZT6_PELTS|nr:hypothetical protein PTH_2325 [Pelotomaculum thermopropionicum SI]